MANPGWDQAGAVCPRPPPAPVTVGSAGPPPGGPCERLGSGPLEGLGGRSADLVREEPWALGSRLLEEIRRMLTLLWAL